MILDALNTIGRLVLTIIVIYKLGQFRDMANGAERFGLGLMGGGSFLTIPNIWQHQLSPFDGWAGNLLTWGAVIFVVGRTYRDRRHFMRNEEAKHAAERHLIARGKL